MNYHETKKTRHILRQIISVMFLAVLAACNAPPVADVSNEITEHPTKPNIDNTETIVPADQNWVILTKEQAEEMGIVSWLVECDDYWTPSENDILLLEGQIPEYLNQNTHLLFRQPPVWERLDEYQRQYIGLLRGGRRIIYGNFFCNPGGVNLQQDLVIVDDGGDCYFQVEYDVDEGMFIKLLVNGES